MLIKKHLFPEQHEQLNAIFNAGVEEVNELLHPTIYRSDFNALAARVSYERIDDVNSAAPYTLAGTICKLGRS